MTNPTTYQPPVNKLLTLGKQQCDYITELGLGSQHVPYLMKMAVDNELLGADSNSTEFWAAIHAWRALGQLRVEDAVALLLPLFDLEDNDAVAEEMPKVYGRIGEKAIPQLQAYLGELEHNFLERTTAINSLEEIANQYPNTRNTVVAALTQQLQAFNQNSAELNGFLISSLVNLQAKESASLIKHTFEASLVAVDVAGSWDDVRESLGISDNYELEFQPDVVEVVELSTPVINIQVPIPGVEEVSQATTPSISESDRESSTVESTQVAATDAIADDESHQVNPTVESTQVAATDAIADDESEVTTPSISDRESSTVESTQVAATDAIADDESEVTTPSISDRESLTVESTQVATTDAIADDESHQESPTVESTQVATTDGTEVVEIGEVSEVTALSPENPGVESIPEVSIVEETAIENKAVVEAGSENTKESALNVVTPEQIVEDLIEIEVNPQVSIAVENVVYRPTSQHENDSDSENENLIESQEKSSSVGITPASRTPIEENKGFGAVTTTKGKSKASKKKKPNFSDL
jgi:hypothetical protein